MLTVGIADELGNGCSPTCSSLLIVSTLGRLGDGVARRLVEVREHVLAQLFHLGDIRNHLEDLRLAFLQ